jgi:opacity protein-like surface antigen
VIGAGAVSPRGTSLVVVAAVVVLAISRSAAAQSPGRIEVGGGARWSGSTSFGEVAATETIFGGGTRELFQSSTELDQSTGVEVRIGVRLTSLLQVEGAVALNRTDLATHVSGDVEAAADTSAAEPVTQYAFEGGVLVPFARGSRGRLTPFATAGAAYLRQLHDGRTLLDTGHAYYVGGGVKYLLTAGGTGHLKATGLRADLRAVFASTGIAPDDKLRTAPSVSGSYFIRF